MYENVYLLDHTPNVIKSGDKYVVDYGSGSCTYEYRTIGKRIKQKVLLMTESNMGGVIDEVNKKSPLTEGDFKDLRMEIMNHSLYHVEKFIQHMGHHQ
jgi:hypothetical protein